MFTGLVEKTGRLAALRAAGQAVELAVACEPWDEPLAVGESVAVNGACLTVARRDGGGFVCNVLKETLARTALGDRRPGALLNLERALRLGDRLGGHMVSGHVDGVGTLTEIGRDGADYLLRVHCGGDLTAGMVLKGSVACEGVSLTLAGLWEDGFQVNIIPHTWRATNLERLKSGDKLNIETDMIGKYVARLLQERGVTARPVTEELLRQAGFA